MLDAREDTTYIYVFAGVIPALTPIIFTVAGNGMIVREIPEGIVSETAHITLVLAAAQARSSLVDFMAAWKKLATPRGGRKNIIITDGGLASSKANRDRRSGSRHVISEKENGEARACEAKARNKNKEIRK
jgi:hypothetical protein